MRIQCIFESSHLIAAFVLCAVQREKSLKEDLKRGSQEASQRECHLDRLLQQSQEANQALVKVSSAGDFIETEPGQVSMTKGVAVTD